MTNVNEPEVESPCTGVCALDAEGYCRGCLRSGDEIAAWPHLGAEARRELLQRLGERARQR